MPASRRVAVRSVLACACALALGAANAGAANAPVAVGDYEGAPVLDAGGTYQGAYFSVTKDAGRRAIVAREDLDGIYYPDVGKCDDLSLPLAADSVPVSSAARFKIRDTTPIEQGEIVVVWKGHWKKAKRLAGTITIKNGDCSSKADWTARKVAKPAQRG